jgi:hypothetical protein
MGIIGNIQNHIVVIYEIEVFLCNLSSGEIFSKQYASSKLTFYL